MGVEAMTTLILTPVYSLPSPPPPLPSAHSPLREHMSTAKPTAPPSMKATAPPPTAAMAAASLEGKADDKAEDKAEAKGQEEEVRVLQ